MVNKKVKKVIAKRTVKTDIPSLFDMKTGIDVGKGKKTIPKKVNPFVKQPMAAMMNIPVPAKKVVKKKKKVVKKPKFNYSKSFKLNS